MTLHDRLRQLASALPSDDSAVTITRADLLALLERDSRETEVGSTRDLTVEEVARSVADLHLESCRTGRSLEQTSGRERLG